MTAQSTRFIEDVLLKGLNDVQRYCVTHTYLRNSLVLAGAGSGKTSVIARRISFIAAMGYSVDSIVAVTFTTKAAKELRERVGKYIGKSADRVMMGTFHSICLKLLRQFACYLGVYTNQFNVLDPEDGKSVLTEILNKTIGYSDAQTLNAYKEQISQLKNRLVTPNQFESYMAANLETDYDTHKNGKILVMVYQEYENLLRRKNAMDFDDLIINMINALNIPIVKSYCQNRFKFIMCDEVQDTNTAQFKLLEELTGDNNLFLVGDDSQSIYGFRGAKFENMFEFLKKYPTAETIKLVQNYRSSRTIVEAANTVIKNNQNRFDKICFTQNQNGERIMFRSASDSFEEVGFVINEIQKLIRAGYQYKDLAVLYRVNSLGAEFEKGLVAKGIPCSVIRGTGFYQRAEIKDITAILKAANNPKDFNGGEL